MSLINGSEQLSKRKLDDYALDGDDSSSSVRLRTDVSNSVSSPHQANVRVCDTLSAAACYPELSKARSCIQFFVRMISGLNLLVRADFNDTIETVHDIIHSRTGIPKNEQRLIYKSRQLYWEQTLGECGIEKDSMLQLVGIMRSTSYPDAYALVDEIVCLIRMLCKGKSENVAEDEEARVKIKYNLSDYFDKLPQNDYAKASRYLQVFWSLCVPADLAMLYMSPGNKIFGNELVSKLIQVITFMPHGLHQQCAPILIEICKSLRKVPYYDNDVVFNMCRSCLVNMVGYIKIGRVSSSSTRSTNSPVTFSDMVDFVAEAAIKITSYMHVGIKGDTSMGLSLPLKNDVLYLKNFMIPVSDFIKEEIFPNNRYSEPSRNSHLDFSRYREDYTNLGLFLFNLFKRMNYCLEEMELLLPTKSESLGCYQYLVILMELNNIFKFYPGFGKLLWTTLRERKLSLCYLIIKYARSCDDYGWISEHKEVTNFECRRHLAMMLLPEIRDENDDVLEMLIKRSQLLEESFEYIAHAEADTLRAGLLLEFKDEEATGPGVLREWFILVCQAIFDPQNALFVACPNDRRRFFPNPGKLGATFIVL